MPAATAVTGSPVETKLTTTTVSVTSSTDADLRLLVRATRYADAAAGTPTTTVHVRVSRGSLEQHEWVIGVPDGDFTDDSGTNSAQLDASTTDLGQYGQLNLTATPVGNATTMTCPDGSSEVVQAESVGGSVDFATRSGVWGRVTVAHVQFTGTSRLVREYGTADDACFAPTQPGLTSCTPSLQWTVPTSDAQAVVIGGWRLIPRASYGLLTASRGVMLGGTPVAMRIDTDNRHVHIPTAEVWTTHAVAHIYSSAAQAVYGSAVIRSTGSPTLTTMTCRGVFPQIRKRSFPATFVPSAGGMRIRQAIGGTITIRGTTGARIAFLAPPGQQAVG